MTDDDEGMGTEREGSYWPALWILAVIVFVAVVELVR
jgi:hypothetical protein